MLTPGAPTAMESLGAAASVIAVVNLSAKIATLCFQYSASVANARSDIARLYEQVKILDTTFQSASRLLEAPNSGLLSASRQLVDQLRACEGELERLRAKLELGTARKAMRRVGLRALKWPFSSKDTDSIVATLGRYQQNIAVSLQVDQTYVLLLNDLESTLTLFRHILLGIDKGIQGLSLQSAEDISKARKPHFIIPFPRDSDFVERPALQSWVREQYAGPASRMALVGLGGFGYDSVGVMMTCH